MTTTPPDPREPELVTVVPVATAVIRGVVPMNELAGFFDRSFSTLASVLSSQRVAIGGPAFARYHGPPAANADLEVGFATDGVVAPDGDVEASSLPGGRVARLVHAGSFDLLATSWERLREWIRAQGLTPLTDLWEVYLTEPTPDMDPADLRTELNWLTTM
jgi:effector-binding domain-containing protein